jgi:hypothetical protein
LLAFILYNKALSVGIRQFFSCQALTIFQLPTSEGDSAVIQ